MPAKRPEIHFDWSVFQTTLSEELDLEVRINSIEPIGGGDTSRGFKLSTNIKDYFVKLNRVDALEMFRAEWAGIAELTVVESLNVPEPILVGVTQKASFLVMEYLELKPQLDQAAAGAVIADMHKLHHTKYGWDRNNFIGTSVQQNGWHLNWSEFYWNCRLEPQLVRAAESGFHLLEQAIDPLRDKSSKLLRHHEPTPVLVHGDLWHGNIASSESGTVLYDPAVYWGDPETDIAMTQMLDGFDDAFYEAYSAKIPDEAGKQERMSLYELYHWLNHLNLFGQSYLEPTLNCISRLYETE